MLQCLRVGERVDVVNTRSTNVFAQLKCGSASSCPIAPSVHGWVPCYHRNERCNKRLFPPLCQLSVLYLSSVTLVRSSSGTFQAQIQHGPETCVLHDLSAELGRGQRPLTGGSNTALSDTKLLSWAEIQFQHGSIIWTSFSFTI